MQRGTKNRLAFTTAEAARPFLTSTDSQWAAFEPALRQRLADPATEISFSLGFDQPTSFYRAFRIWTGTTPDSVRHELGVACRDPAIIRA